MVEGGDWVDVAGRRDFGARFTCRGSVGPDALSEVASEQGLWEPVGPVCRNGEPMAPDELSEVESEFLTEVDPIGHTIVTQSEMESNTQSEMESNTQSEMESDLGTEVA
jgi:hypothetical protein